MRARSAQTATTEATTAGTLEDFFVGAGEGEGEGVVVEEGDAEAVEEEEAEDAVSIRTQLALPRLNSQSYYTNS